MTPNVKYQHSPDWPQGGQEPTLGPDNHCGLLTTITADYHTNGTLKRKVKVKVPSFFWVNTLKQYN